MKKIKEHTEHEYIINCRITRKTNVIVLAVNEEAAILKFEQLDWEAEDSTHSEIVDFEIDGGVVENK